MNSAGSWWDRMKNLIPELNKVLAIILLVLNCIFPGVGTMCLSCLGPRFVWDHLIIGLLQLLLSFLIIGWVWSIFWGILLVMKSN